MFYHPSGEGRKNDLAGIRLAAAEHGADAVLVLNGITEVDRYNNFASFSLLNGGGSVVGTWHAHGFFVCFGWSYVGRQNQYLYLSVESEGLASKTGPQMILKDKDSVVEAKKRAVQSFGPELEKRVRAVSKARKSELVRDRSIPL